MDNFQKKVKEKIKLYSNEEYLKGYIKNEFLTDDNDADIYLKIKNKEELFDSKSYKMQLELNNDIYTFIEQKTAILESNVPINLHIVGLTLTEEDQEKIKHLVKEHYAIELYNIQKKYLHTRRKIKVLVMSGITFLLGYLILYLCTQLNFFMEVFCFLFSFSLWEALDCVIYAFSDIKEERNNVTQNLLINVAFDNKENM